MKNEYKFGNMRIKVNIKDEETKNKFLKEIIEYGNQQYKTTSSKRPTKQKEKRIKKRKEKSR